MNSQDTFPQFSAHPPYYSAHLDLQLAGSPQTGHYPYETRGGATLPTSTPFFDGTGSSTLQELPYYNYSPVTPSFEYELSFNNVPLTPYSFSPSPYRPVQRTQSLPAPSRHVPQAPSVNLREMEAAFSVGLFEGLQSRKDPNGKPINRSRALYQWPFDVDTEDRLLVVLNAMRRAGFDTLGTFLMVLLSPKARFAKHTGIAKTVAMFISAKDLDPRCQPLQIIEGIFNHPRSQEFNNRIPTPVSFTLPPYALPPSQRKCRIPLEKNTTTRNMLTDWAFQKVLHRVDKESSLLSKQLGSTGQNGRFLSWSAVLEFDLTSCQEAIAVNAPVTFALVSTIATNTYMRSQMQSTVKKAPAPPGSEDDVSMSSDTETESQAGNDMNPPPTPTPAGNANVHRRGHVFRDPWLAVTVAILALLHIRYKPVIMLQMFIGLFLFSCNANRDIITILCRVGFSISYSAILRQLHTLSEDASNTLRNIGNQVQHSQPTFLILFDNVNKMRRAWQKTVNRADEMKSGTAATLVELEDVPDGAFNLDALTAKLAKKPRSALTVEKLLQDIDWSHIEGVGHATVLRVWVKHLSALHRFREDTEKLFTETYAKHKLRCRKSRIHTLRSTDIDESTTAGTKQVLRNIFISQLGIAASWLLRWIYLICGDQLSIDRVRKIKLYMAKVAGHESHQWALPVIQLWHLKWNWQKAIFRSHWHPTLGSRIFGLHFDAQRMRRDKFNPEKCEFYPAHAILEDRFEALILHALRILCEEESGIVTPVSAKLIDGANSYFTDGGYFDRCSFQQLKQLSRKVYRRYMCSVAYEDALGYSPRPEDIYGKENASRSHPGTSAPDHSLPAISAPKPSATTKRRARKGVAASTRNISEGDQCLANDICFLRVTFWYLELCAAIAEGDIGRVFEVIKLLRFSFWGTGSTNYGNELLELACNFLYEFPPDLTTAILNNYLVNTTGRPGHWFELDLLQEHFNFWIKQLFNSKSHEFDSKHLAEAVGLNIRGIGTLRERICEIFGVRQNSGNHTNPVKVDDINEAGSHYRQSHILYFRRSRNQVYLVDDEFAEGHGVLLNGQLRKFLDRTLLSQPVQDEETSGAPADGVPDLDALANPITSENGRLHVNEFLNGCNM